MQKKTLKDEVIETLRAGTVLEGTFKEIAENNMWNPQILGTMLHKFETQKKIRITRNGKNWKIELN